MNGLCAGQTAELRLGPPYTNDLVVEQMKRIFASPPLKTVGQWVQTLAAPWLLLIAVTCCCVASAQTTANDAGVAALVGSGAGLFLLGHWQNDDQKRETGILAGEAAIGAFVDNEVFKYAAARERPFTGSGTGRFFVGGDSFPSTHAAVSWAIASVIAHEYSGPITQFLAYGMAG